jgi:hypothetical protein
MPNWTECDLEITATTKKGQVELKRFKEFASSKRKGEDGKDEIQVLDEEKFIPYPQEFRDKDKQAQRYSELKNKKGKSQIEKKELLALEISGANEKDGFNDGGYEWCSINWGTKWGICHSNLYGETDKNLSYGFDCAWSPCVPVILKMAEMFPDLKFNLKYWEGGMGFRGILTLKGKKILNDKHYSNYRGDRGG